MFFPGAEAVRAPAPRLLGRGPAALFPLTDGGQHEAPRLAEDRLEHGLLRREVVVDEAVGDTGLLRDVADARVVVALAREDAHGGVEDQPSLVLRGACHSRGSLRGTIGR